LCLTGDWYAVEKSIPDVFKNASLYVAIFDTNALFCATPIYSLIRIIR
jgi:hypothetical protein